MIAASLLIIALLYIPPCDGSSSDLDVREHFLENGLQILIVEDHSAPVFMGAWVARVGSVNERPGITGLTHLLEHMMFKGTKVIGTKDIDRDLEIIDMQENLRDEMRRMTEELRWAVRRGEYEDIREALEESEEYRALESEFEVLEEAQKEIMIPNEYSRIYEKNGELMVNAYTNNDVTAYFNVIPANKLELWFWMESDRLLNPVFREFYTERSVVYEERRMRTESTPTGKHKEALNAMFWEAHPYGWPVIGWPSDVSELSMKQAEDYFRTYYGAGNLSIILAGDIEPDRVLELAAQYFGRLPAGDIPPPVITMEPEQVGEKRYYGEADVNPSVTIMFHGGGFKNKDAPVLTVIASLLNIDSGPFERKLVREQKIAVEASAYQHNSKYGGIFYVSAEAFPGISHDALEKALLDELDLLKREKTVDRELQKIKNNYLTHSYRKEGSLIWRAFSLLSSAGKGDWREAFNFERKIQSVTAEDILDVAENIFTKSNRTTALWSRSNEDAGESEEIDEEVSE